MKRKNKDMIHFSGRRHSKLGVLSTLIGSVVVIGFIAISIISGIRGGQGGVLLGIGGLALLALSAFGFVISYKAFKDKDIFYRFPIIGAALNGFMLIFLFILYILGIAL